MPLATLLLAAAVQSAPLVPNGPWVVRAEEDMCLLERSYPVPDGKVSLIFQPLLDLDDMEVFILTPDRAGTRRQGTYQASVAPGPASFKGQYVSNILAQSKGRLTRLTTKRAMLDGLVDNDVLHIQARPVDHGFVIRRPEKARIALRDCVDKLKRAWGIDPDVASRAVSTIEGNPGRYFGPEDYPSEAYTNGVYGRVIALLSITPQGTVEKCRIVKSAGSALNDGTCRSAMKIRFKPPRDKDGTPLPSTYLLPVRWMLPGAPQ